MPLYRKLPVVVEAVQWLKDGDHPMVEKVPRSKFNDKCECGLGMLVHGQVKTLESFTGFEHRVCPSDWIITGAVGEVYPCKAPVFKQTYEEVIPYVTD